MLLPLQLLLPLLLLLPGCRAAARCPHCPACPPPPAPCQLDRCAGGDCFYSISGGQKLVIYTTVGRFTIECSESMLLDDEAMPRFEEHVSVGEATVSECAPPNGSYASALGRLGVGLQPGGQVALSRLPRGAELRAHHFRGLETLSRLLVVGLMEAPVRADAGALQPLLALTWLTLHNVALGAGGLQRLPARLLELLLFNVVRAGLPPLALPRLRRLELFVCDKCAPAAGPDPLLLGDAANATLTGACAALRELSYMSHGLGVPAGGWLAGCGGLSRLELQLLEGPALPAGLLRGAPALVYLKLSAPRLRALPPDLLHYTHRLAFLDLSYCGLISLPDSMFNRTVNLMSLNLAGNALAGSARALLRSLGALGRLRDLRLDRNPLGDLCPLVNSSHRTGMSPLADLVQVQTLSLVGVGVSRICPDWRTALLDLTTLNLKENRITVLEYADMWWEPRRGGGRVRVQLQGNPLGGVRLPAPQPRAAAPAAAPTVEFEVSAALRCDCRTYRLARALRERRLRAEFVGLRCLPPPRRPRSPCSAPLVPRGAASAELPFDKFHLDDMVCPLAKDCPRGCYCDERGDETLRVECALANLTELPELRELPGRRVSLCVASSRVARLPPALPARLAELDLRDNELLEPSAAEVAALLADNRTVQLAGNPLLCGCPSPLLQALTTRLYQVTDAGSVRCSDNRTLQAALSTECASGARELAPLLALCVLLALAAALLLLLRLNARLRLRAALLARGLCLKWDKPRDEEHYMYDVFLAFSHHDAAVADELLRRLEAGAAPLRVCVHHRDWRAGDFIPAQIARSVAASRRTVVLLSESFAQSSWARAEFREAYARAVQAGGARPLLLLRGRAAPRGLEPELQHYVENNTYVRWGEPGFWDKLRLALPPPRAAAAPPRPAPPASPAVSRRRVLRQTPPAPPLEAPGPSSPSAPQ